MDELVVVGRVGEQVDHLLRDGAPGRCDFGPDAGHELINGYWFQAFGSRYEIIP
jgi:hypothetical protein